MIPETHIQIILDAHKQIALATDRLSAVEERTYAPGLQAKIDEKKGNLLDSITLFNAQIELDREALESIM